MTLCEREDWEDAFLSRQTMDDQARERMYECSGTVLSVRHIYCFFCSRTEKAVVNVAGTVFLQGAWILNVILVKKIF